VARRASSLGRAGLALAFLQRLFRRLAHLGVGRLLADIFQTRLGDLTPGGIAQLFLEIRHVIQRGALAVGGPGNAGVLGGVRRRGLGLGGVLAHVARLGRRLGYSTLRRLLGSAANGVLLAFHVARRRRLLSQVRLTGALVFARIGGVSGRF